MKASSPQQERNATDDILLQSTPKKPQSQNPKLHPPNNNIQTFENSAFKTPLKTDHISIDTTTLYETTTPPWDNGSTPQTATTRRRSPKSSPTNTTNANTTPSKAIIPLVAATSPSTSSSPRNAKFSPINNNMKRKKRKLKKYTKLEIVVTLFLLCCLLSMVGMFFIGSKLVLYTNKVKDEVKLDTNEREADYVLLQEKEEKVNYSNIVAPHQAHLHQNDRFGNVVYPRILHFASSPLQLEKHASKRRKFTPDPMLSVTPGEESPPNDLRRKPYVEGNCVPMADWQIQSFPNCNVVHEMHFGGSGGLDLFIVSPEGEMFKGKLKRRSITSIGEEIRKNVKLKEDQVKYLGKGWFRQAWQVDHGGGAVEESTVIKVLREDRDFYDEFYELHRRDAVAMERLTFSPYILDIYGYCGQTALNELANLGHGLVSLENLKMKLRDNNQKSVTRTKLQIGAMIALGVSHIHELGYDSGIPFMAHYDINPRNIAIMEGGRPKINDFNVAEFLRWDTKKNESCGFQGRFHDPWWRAPEEMIMDSSLVHDVNGTKKVPYTTGISDNPPLINEKVDVYALGNVLYDLLTGHSPRGKMYERFKADARERVLNGEPPTLPRYHEKSSDPSIVAMRHAMRKCWEKDPKKRASAREVADDLANAAMKLQKEKEGN